MPFDGTNFHQPPPSQPGPEMPSDKVLSRFVLFLAIVLIVTPFSMFGLVDLVHALMGK
ncbi:MAG TPA: hypothetical protein VL752_05440 [Acidisoma sp.]|jgi:hypothetical protein|uniref:hypothetical protein n=1 Tax=Acidisoma sp. TaxID=1872115 RepID=UPI002BC0B12C|nr:hypothetical protein [Acidisoma sp.]HTI00375.1 hypothetical protein [Acidisoma sp.]